MVIIARTEDGEDCVPPQRLTAPDEIPLAQVEALIWQAKEAPVSEIPAFRKMLKITRLPLPIRRLLWAFGLGFGRHRASSSAVSGALRWLPLAPGNCMR